MTRYSLLTRLLLLALTVSLLGACGKKGSLDAPEGEAERYTFPGFYPNPATVVPGAEAEPQQDLNIRGEDDDVIRLSPFPDTDGTTVIYGPVDP